MKRILTAMLFSCLISVASSYAIVPVHATCQKQPPSKLSRFKSALLKLSPVHHSARIRQFMIVDHWGGELETTLPSTASRIEANSMSTGAKAGVGIGVAVGVLWYAQLLGLIPDP